VPRSNPAAGSGLAAAAAGLSAGRGLAPTLTPGLLTPRAATWLAASATGLALEADWEAGESAGLASAMLTTRWLLCGVVPEVAAGLGWLELPACLHRQQQSSTSRTPAGPHGKNSVYAGEALHCLDGLHASVIMALFKRHTNWFCTAPGPERTAQCSNILVTAPTSPQQRRPQGMLGRAQQSWG
jgi:hypothetical protein